MKISVCIPTYDDDGSNIPLIRKNLNSCLSQDYDDYEIIVSDHSIKDNVKNLILEIGLDKIKYLRNEKNIGYPAYNTNNAIINSSGEFIKIMNQDDYFNNESVLKNMVELTKKNKWVLSGFIHFNNYNNNFFNYMTPIIYGNGNHLLSGINTVGCPSVGLIPKNELIDTNIIYMIDCELWYRLFKKFGSPAILNGDNIVVVMGEHNLSTKLADKSKKMILQDKEYCYKKYKL